MTWGRGLQALVGGALCMSACGDIRVGEFSADDESGSTGSPPGAYVAVGPDFRRTRSVDGGATWPVDEFDGSDPERVLHAIAVGGGQMVAVGGLSQGRAYVSEDGLDWQAANIPAGGPLYDVVYTGSRFVAVGEQGRVVFSDDAQTWEARDAEILGPGLWALASDGAQALVAVGDGDVTASFDGGNTWLAKFNDGRSYSGVAAAPATPGGFVVVDEEGGVHVPFEGLGAWERSTIESTKCFGIERVEDRLWALCEGELLTSDLAATTWTRSALPESMTAVAAGPDSYVGIGGGDRLRSDDGLTWERTVSDPLGQLHDVVFVPGLP